jgi:hypothetical protein
MFVWICDISIVVTDLSRGGLSHMEPISKDWRSEFSLCGRATYLMMFRQNPARKV